MMTERFALLLGYGITTWRDINTHTHVHIHVHAHIGTLTCAHILTYTCRHRNLLYFNHQSRMGKGVERERKQLTFPKFPTASCVKKSLFFLWTVLLLYSLVLRGEGRKKHWSEEPESISSSPIERKAIKFSGSSLIYAWTCRGFLKNIYIKKFCKADFYA